ncbi:MAG: tRNA pseudouridine(38-40) synthase TruA [Planctomycetes bacterium RBG_16_55_9]|nr:MAG: tRNA pseudouridine(38-40) synthase TruA [Planctomycetes bacterium RBG_16_55_9]
MAVRTIKLIVQYDGSRYHGWQIQPGRRTIQGELVEAVSNLVGTRTHVHGASRTDAGVSALGQVALFEVDSPIPTENFPKAINGRLPRDIVVTAAEEPPPKFDLMGGVKSKLYRYTIFTGRYRPVLRLNRCWHIPRKLDVAAMNQAAQLLVGTKDFKSFAGAKDRRDQTVRTIFRCEVTAEDEWIYIDVEGDGFLYNMVRNIVGTLVDIGVGRWQPEKIKEILETRNRTAAGRLAPPQGLCLMWIKY